ncbi:MAG: putative lipid II flippase FtsW [Oscillospiraceae bacterium]|nr:putative lipid II flippase FtsW [Oscillospiraceae bacterium]
MQENSKSHENTKLHDYSDDAKIGRGRFDLPFALLTLVLLVIGVVMVLSASFARAYYDPTHETGGNATYYFIRQLIFALMGVAAMYITSRFPMTFYRRFSMWVLIVAIGLLLLVPVIGVKANGARRWIGFGSFTIQPSEIAKIGVILAFSSMICRYREKMKTFRYGIAPFLVILIVIVGLLALEPHLSAAIIIVAVGAVMLFIGGVRLYWFVGVGVAVAGLGAVAISVMDYAKERVANWLDPFSAASDAGYQIVQSLYAVGSGGLMGVGLGQSRQKYLYLPEEHNDFIFSIVCEELGFIGAALILILFALLIVRGYWLAMHMRDRYSCLVCTGITTLLALQVFLNVAVVTNLIPCTGISLPFFSYGGTALLIQMAEMGIILSASRDVPTK